MALERADLALIQRLVQDHIGKLPPRPVAAQAFGTATIDRLGGKPTVETPPATDSSERVATTAFVQQALPAVPVSSVFGRTGAVAATSGDYSVGQITGAAPLASPAFTGTPTSPTPSTADNSTNVATTAFVKSQSGIRVANRTLTANYSTAATSFATSTDMFSVAASFTADGVSSYLVTFTAPAIFNNTLGDTAELWWSIDGAQKGLAAQMISAAASDPVPLVARTTISTPTAGSHTVNLRGQVNAGTMTVDMGSLATGFGPGVLTIEVL